MSVFAAPRDRGTVAAETMPYGPRLGFLGAMEAAYQAEARANSAYGLEVVTRNYEMENIQRIRAAGGEAPEALVTTSQFAAGINAGPYTDYVTALANGDPAAITAVLGDREEKLRELQRQYPDAGIQTYGEIFDQVRTEALHAEYVNTTSPRTLGGQIGAFIGGMGGQLDVTVNPWSFASIPVGGFGRGALTRIAAEGAVQSGVEAVNQFAWIRQQRDVLGLPSYTALSIGMAGLGGGVLQGAFEGIRVAAGRWFRTTPDDPAPNPPSPPPRDRDEGSVPGMALGAAADGVPVQSARTPSRAARLSADMNTVRNQLEDWQGPSPWATRAMATAMPTTPVDTRTATTLVSQSAGETLDEVARRIDPETFDIYDKIAQKRADRQAELEYATGKRDQKLDQRLNEIRDEVNRLTELRDRQPNPYGKAAQKYDADRRALISEANDALNRSTAETPWMNRARRELLKWDEQMRDLAPEVSRAYARAQSKWDLMEDQRRDISNMMALNAKAIDKKGNWNDFFDNYLRNNNQTPELPLSLRYGAADNVQTAIDASQKAVDDSAKRADEAIENAKQVLKEIEEQKDALKPAPKTKHKVEVEHQTMDDGMEIATLKTANGGELVVEITREAVQVRAVHVYESQRGQGVGMAMYQRALQLAAELGVPFRSDGTVSVSAVKVWDGLAKRGYKVEKSDDAEVTGADGAITALDYVFQIDTIKSPGFGEYIAIPGVQRRLHIDEAKVETPEGPVTVRQLLEDMAEDATVLNAVTKCSGGKTS